MSFLVSFLNDVQVKAEHLHDFLTMAGGAPATVTPVGGTTNVTPTVRKSPAARGAAVLPAGPVAAVVGSDPASVPAKTRAPRRTKAQMAEAALAAAAPVDSAAAAAPDAGASAADAPVAAATPAKRTRTKKDVAVDAAVAALTAVATGKGKAGAAIAAAASVASDVDPGDLLGRFAKLIDSDFSLAKSLLDEFGVNRFSDLKPEALAAFALKLTEAGV